MATSSSRRQDRFSAHATALAAAAWTELGVSGWTSSHSDWGIDPEPLMLFTAWLGDTDPRLRDESLDWCIRNWRLISKTRLRNLAAAQPAGVRDAFGEYAATVAAHAGVTWPGATEPRRYTVTGRSTQPVLERPAAAWLRIRALFGIGARAEILRCLLSSASPTLGTARLADLTGYTKRNIAEECDTLHRAGLLAVRTRGNRFTYSLRRRAALEAFVGELPAVRPHWTALLNITRELVSLEARARTASLTTLPVHVRRALDRMADDLDELDIEAPHRGIVGDDLWPAVRSLGDRHLGAWAAGQWPEPGEDEAEVHHLR